jgi:FkbM family methyltransferase
MTYTTVHGVELLTDRDRIALLVEGSDVFASTRQGPQEFEPQTAAAFVQAIRARPGCVIDIGAYTGLFTLLAVRAGAPEVIALEPNPAGYERLLQNLEHAGWPSNVRAVSAAADAHRGVGFLEVSDERLGICSTGKLTGPVVGGMPNVEIVTIDTLHRAYPTSVLKIDVEGHEMPVLMGARETLLRDRPVVFVEVDSRNGGDRRDAILGFFRGLGGYTTGQALDDRNWVLSP